MSAARLTGSDVKVLRAALATQELHAASIREDEAVAAYTQAKAEFHVARQACTEDERKRADDLLLELESGPSLGVVA